MKKSRERWWDTRISRYFKKRRAKYIENIFGGFLLDKKYRILEVGCSNGKDFLSFYSAYTNIEFVGVDLDDRDVYASPNFTFLKCDAESLPFVDKEFDLVVSIGVLEHIQPMEKLAVVISEIARVGRSYINVVPSIDSIIEPHTLSIFWQLKGIQNKINYKHAPLFHMSDNAWLNFSGFSQARTCRNYYIPFLVKNLIIYNIGKS